MFLVKMDQYSKFFTLRLWIKVRYGNMLVHSALIRNLKKLKGKTKPTLQYHFMTPRESYFTQFEILLIQEDFTL